MMNDPIVIWPPGTYYWRCEMFGWHDCSYSYPEYYSQGALVCCPGW